MGLGGGGREGALGRGGGAARVGTSAGFTSASNATPEGGEIDNEYRINSINVITEAIAVISKLTRSRYPLLLLRQSLQWNVFK